MFTNSNPNMDPHGRRITLPSLSGMFPHPTSQLSGMRGMSDSDPSVFGLARETLPHLPFRPGGHSLASRPAKNEHYSQADLRPRTDIRSILASDPVPRHAPSDHSNNRHSSTQDIQGISRSYAPYADHSPEPQTPVLYGSPVGNHKEPSYSQYENVSRGHFAPYTWNSQPMEPRQPPVHFQEPLHFQEVDMGECNAVTKTKRRGNLPKKAVEILKYWFISHQAHPYPTEEEKQAFVKTTGLSMSQVNNWFINARRRNGPKLANQATAHGMLRDRHHRGGRRSRSRSISPQ